MKNRKIRSLADTLTVLLVSASFVIFSPCTGLAEDIDFEVTVDRNKVYLGSNIRLDLNFYGTQNMPTPTLPEIDGFEWRYLGPSSRISIVNGASSSSITHMYALEPQRTGVFDIPAIVINYRGETYFSKPIQVEVVKSQFSRPSSGSRGRSAEGRSSGLDDRIFIVMEAGKKSAYINEVIPVTIRLYVRKLSIRDIQYPQFPHEGFLAGDFSKPRQYRQSLSGSMYEVIEFATEVSAVRAGSLKLGPAELGCNLLMRKKARRPFSFYDDDFFGFDDFFDRYEKHSLTLNSPEIPVLIMPLPSEDVPTGFAGAVGDYRFYLEAAPKDVRVGDPITLKMIVTGEGNFKTVKPPKLSFGGDFKTYDPEIKKEEGRKIFEQVIIPTKAGISRIPAIGFSFFDTASGAYKTVTKGPVPITVTPLPEGEEFEIFEAPEFRTGPKKEEIFGRDIIYIKDKPGVFQKRGMFLYKSGLFAALQVIPLIIIGALVAVKKRTSRLQTDIRYARRLRARGKARKSLKLAQKFLAGGDPAGFYGTVFKTLQEYLGDKFHLPAGGITAEVTKDLQRFNIPKDLINEIEACFGRCDRARYAPSSATSQDMKTTFELLSDIIEKLERTRV